MSYIFLDESGDLGFDWNKTKTSKYFIITALFSAKKINLDKIVKKVFKSFSKKELKRHKSVLHSYNELPKTRIRLFTGKIELIASRRETNKFLNLNFKNYIEQQAKQKHHLDLKVEIKQLHEDKSLQIVDFVCWAIFRKYEHSDISYIDIIKPKIVQENPLFP